MKQETAKKVILKEAEFLGITYTATMNEIAKFGKMIFSDKAVQAYELLTGLKVQK